VSAIISTNFVPAVLTGGILCGVLDLTCALVAFRIRGIRPIRALQGIASAALGASALQGGKRTATLGTFFHFVVAFSATAVYCLASSRLFFLINHPFVYGPLYGIAVHLFMTFAVLPLSAAKRPFLLSAFLIQFVIHMFAVGLPIALVARHFLQ
jgi:hypothetical protein